MNTELIVSIQELRLLAHGVSTNKSREVLTFGRVLNGTLDVTDGHFAGWAPSELPEGLWKLEGFKRSKKQLGKTAFKLAWSENGITTYIGENGAKLIHRQDGEGYKFPNIDEIKHAAAKEDKKRFTFALDTVLLMQLVEAIGLDNRKTAKIRLSVNLDDRLDAIQISSMESELDGLLMPCKC